MRNFRQDLFCCLLARELLAAGARADHAGDAVRIHDEDDRSVAEDRVAGEERDVPELRAHRLHDNLLGVEDAVNEEAEALPSDLAHHHEAFVAGARL
jgi:hypothetical protein